MFANILKYRVIFDFMARLTIRFPESQYERLEDFLKSHPDCNRSKLIREAVKYFIRKSDWESPNGIHIQLDEKTKERLDNLIEFRYFRDYSDLVSYVMKTLVIEGKLKEILDEVRYGESQV